MHVQLAETHLECNGEHSDSAQGRLDPVSGPGHQTRNPRTPSSAPHSVTAWVKTAQLVSVKSSKKGVGHC